MKISIVMATYNGEKYILEQLESIRKQTLLPDEVLIWDDCSIDNTVSIIKSYIKKYHLNNWLIRINEENKGWEKNFFDGIKSANGDLIFLCDQDDIWHNNKVETMSNIMNINSKILLLSSNLNWLFMNKTIKKQKMLNDKTIYQYKFKENYLFVKRPGCTYAIRKELINKSVDFWFEKYPHDALLWRVANAFDGLYIYNDCLIDHRRHDSNATNIKQRTISHTLNTMRYYEIVIEQFINMGKKQILPDNDKKLNFIIRSEKWCKRRIMLLKYNKINYWFYMIPLYKYYYSKKSFYGDLYYVMITKLKNIFNIKKKI